MHALTFAALVLALIACKQIESPLYEVKDGSTALSLRVGRIGTAPDVGLRLTPVTADTRVVSITSLQLALAEQAVTLTPSGESTPMSLPSLALQFQAEVAGTLLPCQALLAPYGTSPFAATCVGSPTSVPQPSPSPTPTPAARASFAAADYTQEIVYRPGMYCGLHYGTNKWQKRFDVRIQGSAAALAASTKVAYYVFAGYNGGNPIEITATSANPNFATDVGFMTPVTTWTVGEAKVYTDDTRFVTVPGAQINWTNSDPATPTGATCTPTPTSR